MGEGRRWFKGVGGEREEEQRLLKTPTWLRGSLVKLTSRLKFAPTAPSGGRSVGSLGGSPSKDP